MSISEAMTALQGYDLLLLAVGLAVLAAAVLPRLLLNKPLSLPIVLVAIGFAFFSLPVEPAPPDPVEQGTLAEHLTELGVIVALMGAGLKLDRLPSLRSWGSTWLLLAISMPITIAATAALGYWAVGLAPAAALLLGAAAAPTDPVLATEVQVGSPGEGYEEGERQKHGPTGREEDEVRFSLTSEAGLNDGLAFPFVYLAIAVAEAGLSPTEWLGPWLLVNVSYKLAVGLAAGLALGWVLARSILSVPSSTELAKTMTGLSALAATLIVYGAAEYAGGYGFLAVFVAACAMRNYEQDHEYQGALHAFTEQTELLLTAGILLALGGAIVGGVLAPLTWSAAIVGLLLIFAVRPLAGVIGLSGLSFRSLTDVPWRERLTISFFWIRGVGSLYYLAYATGEANFPGEELLWALVAFTVIASVVVHGITGAPIMQALDSRRAEANAKTTR